MFYEEQIVGDGLPDRTLVLTYDDGPGPNTLPIAEYLRTKDITATFFVIGKHARQRPEVLVRVRALGHQLGNHTWTHPIPNGLLGLSDDVVISEVKQTVELLDSTRGPIAFRAPGGLWSPAVVATLNADAALTNVHVGPFYWNVEGGDWQSWQAGSSPATAAERYLTEIRERGRGIVLLHDSSANGPEFVAMNRTYELTRALVPMLIADGFRFAPLDEVINE